jgi:hypothetical protein
MQPVWSGLTPDGMKADLVVSSLQKCIRRGLEGDAVYFVKQLYNGRKQRTFGCDIWRRLFIISVEDVGLADIIMPLRLVDLERVAKRVGTYNDADLLPVVEAVLLLCRAPKSRVVDDGIHWFDKRNYVPPTMEELDRYVNEAQPVPEPMDDAKDIHTTDGRSEGRTGDAGMEHFLLHGAKLENESAVAPFQAPATLDTQSTIIELKAGMLVRIGSKVVEVDSDIPERLDDRGSYRIYCKRKAKYDAKKRRR